MQHSQLSQEEKVFQVPAETEHCHLLYCRMHFSYDDLISSKAYVKNIQCYIIRSAGTQVFFIQNITTYNTFCIEVDLFFALCHTQAWEIQLTPNKKVNVFSIHKCSCTVQALSAFLFSVHLPVKISYKSSKLLKKRVCEESVQDFWSWTSEVICKNHNSN